jgi:hypothetical protein
MALCLVSWAQGQLHLFIRLKRDHDAVHIDAVFFTAGRLFQRHLTSCEIRGGLSGARATFHLYCFGFTPLSIYHGLLTTQHIITSLLDLRSSQRWLWRVLSSRIFIESQLTFRRNILLPSSRWNKPRKTPSLKQVARFNRKTWREYRLLSKHWRRWQDNIKINLKVTVC